MTELLCSRANYLSVKILNMKSAMGNADFNIVFVTSPRNLFIPRMI